MYMYMYGRPGCDIMQAQEGRGAGVVHDARGVAGVAV